VALINQAKLNRYAELGYNGLFEGKHGVGKTEIIKATFNSLGWNCKYFSASTLDPWVDLIGVPKAKTMPSGDEILSLVRPEFMFADNIDAIFFDELNRAPDKVLNAVMELIQFKSINGFKLKNLKVIWAAINPWDEENTYAVTEMDPAIIDRFHFKIQVPYKVDEEYFTEKFPETGKVFAAWWRSLEADMKNQISPRRLDYAASAHRDGSELVDILPTTAPLTKLREDLESVPFLKRVAGLKTANQVKAFLAEINNVSELLSLVKNQTPAALTFFGKHKDLIPKELIAAALPVAALSKGRQAHLPTQDALEEVLRGKLEDAKHTFEVEAARVFNKDRLYSLEILTNPKFSFLPIIIEELKLYKSNSKAAKDRVYKLTELALAYIARSAHSSTVAIDSFDWALVGLFAAIIVVDQGEQFTVDRSAFLTNKLASGGAVAKALHSLLMQPPGARSAL
jgi:hypothetical protein